MEMLMWLCLSAAVLKLSEAALMWFTNWKPTGRQSFIAAWFYMGLAALLALALWAAGR